MDSHGCAGGERGRSEHGHASPMLSPSIFVREGGQIEAKPSIKIDHSVVIGTMGTDEANVDGCESK